MRSFLKTAFRGLVFGGCALFAVVAANATIPAYVGPGQTGGTVANQPQIIGDLNGLVDQLNALVFNFINFNNSAAEQGELGFSNESSFAQNGTVAVSALGSTGVTGTKGAVNEWLVLVDEGGAVGYVAVYH